MEHVVNESIVSGIMRWVPTGRIHHVAETAKRSKKAIDK